MEKMQTRQRYVESLLAQLRIYHHQGTVVVSNGSQHAYVRASHIPWIMEIFIDKE